MMVRQEQSDRLDDEAPRLNLLLSSGTRRRGNAVEQLPPLLEPMGVRTVLAESGEEAADIIRRMPVHIAVVDLEIPLRPCDGESPSEAGGDRILKLLCRLSEPPPTVVIRPPQPTARGDVRSLSAALRDGAFAVLDHPLNLEAMLEVMRRIVTRHYRDAWPGSA